MLTSCHALDRKKNTTVGVIAGGEGFSRNKAVKMNSTLSLSLSLSLSFSLSHTHTFDSFFFLWLILKLCQYLGLHNTDGRKMHERSGRKDLEGNDHGITDVL